MIIFWMTFLMTLLMMLLMTILMTLLMILDGLGWLLMLDNFRKFKMESDRQTDTPDIHTDSEQWIKYIIVFSISYTLIRVATSETVNILFKGWSLKNVWFSFYPWCVQSELSLVKHGQKSKIRDLSFSKLFLLFDHVLSEITQVEHTKSKKKNRHF